MSSATLSPSNERIRSPREEWANAATHGIGVVAILVASPFLVSVSFRHGGAIGVVSACIFAATAALLYTASTLYHAAPPGRLKRIFQIADHSAIFLLIAGTYTPFTLGALRGPWGWSLFGTIWGLAVLGLATECLVRRRIRALSVGVYLAMGWLAVTAVVPLVTRLPREGVLLILAGGAAYTLGTAFYAAQTIRYFHTIWHGFVLAGTAFHFAAVMHYAM